MQKLLIIILIVLLGLLAYFFIKSDDSTNVQEDSSYASEESYIEAKTKADQESFRKTPTNDPLI
ncbi:MAG: hypothetical protein R3B55_00230 [Candidatus Paceibacterota bacterium]